MRNESEFEEFLGELAEDERKEYEAELDMIDEFGEFPEDDEDDEDGMYVLVKLHKDEKGIGFSVNEEEKYGAEFFEILRETDAIITARTLDNLITMCEKRERNVLARELRAFLTEGQTTIH